MTASEACAHKYAHGEDECSNKQGILADGVTYFLQHESCLWAAHAEYLLDLIIGVVVFFRFVCHCCCQNQSWHLHSFTLRS